MTQEQSQSLNYHDVFFSFYANKETVCSKMVREHMLVYIYSGEYLVEEGDIKLSVRKGECVFLRKDNRVQMSKLPFEDEPFQAVFMTFKRNFLRDFYQTIDRKKLPVNAEKHQPSAIKLPSTPDISSLFQSLVPYFETDKEPSTELMQLKLQEGVYSLLNINDRFYPALFDFTEPWKIDIFDFLENNYMYDLSMEDIAGFTGRSLATFKRDFKKISELPPQRWLMEKRLKVARDKIRNENRKVSDVYLEVGFKNLSHFSTAFKKQFGVSPTVEG
ncbi:MAG: AraC family transcriptional regulator [Paludibacter sp.]